MESRSAKHLLRILGLLPVALLWFFPQARSPILQADANPPGYAGPLARDQDPIADLSPAEQTMGRVTTPTQAPSLPAEPQAEIRSRIHTTYGRLPLYFEANLGQTSPEVQFLARGSGYAIFLKPTEAVLALGPEPARGVDQQPAGPPAPRPEPAGPRPASPLASQSPTVVRLQLVGADPSAQLVGEELLPGKVNYLRGSDPSAWKTDIRTYARVRYPQIYPGIDLVYYGNGRQLEHDFLVAPGADPAQIRFTIGGAESLALDSQGNLVVGTTAGELRLQKPRIYQELDGIPHAVAGSYALLDAEQPMSAEVGFRLAAYDTSKPLIIDPVLVYSTFLGGFGSDQGLAIVVDQSGNAYITGRTTFDFPVSTGAYDISANTGGDAFVTKVNPAGTGLMFSTYLGGTGTDVGRGIAVDGARNIYIVGETDSANFPTTLGAFQTVKSGGVDAFVAKLDASGGSLAYSTFIGGSAADSATGVGVDATGYAHVAGYTFSSNLPTTPSAFQGTKGADHDAFVAKVNPTGSALVYSTFLGGNGLDEAFALALDTSGSAYVTGRTMSTNFPTTPGAFSRIGRVTEPVNSDAFVTKLNPDGKTLAYSTYLGGEITDEAHGVAVDSAGSAYVAGLTYSVSFPVTPGAYDTSLNEDLGSIISDAFVTKLNAAGNGLVYSTYLGGRNTDRALAIAVDPQGHACVTGMTRAPAFPTTSDAFDPTPNGEADAFVTVLSGDGKSLLYSTFLGGTQDDFGWGIAADQAGSVYVAGDTSSSGFPITSSGFDGMYGGGTPYGDAFVAKVSLYTLPVVTVTASDGTAAEAPTNTGSFTVTRTGPKTAPLAVVYSVSGTATPGTDYQALSGTVTIPAGQVSATIPLTPINDTQAEGPETVILTLTANPAYTVGSPNAATVTITSEDKPSVTLTAPEPLATEAGPTPGTFRVNRTGPTTSPLTVAFTRDETATAGVDYFDFLLTLTIPAGESFKDLLLIPKWDASAEPVETVTLTLKANAAYVIGTPSSASVRIVSAEDNVVTISALDPLATEAGLTPGTFRVSRTGPTTSALTVAFTRTGTATPGLDYVDFPLTITIPAGASVKDLVLTPKADALAEPVETVTLTLSASSAYGIGTPSAATVSLVSAEDPVVTITAITPTVTENALTQAKFRVSRTGPTTAGLAVLLSLSGTASAGLDYEHFTSSGTFIPAGQSFQDIPVTLINDTLIEPPETIILSLKPRPDAYVIGSPESATVTILSDEKPVVTIAATDSTAGESPGNPGKFRVNRTGELYAPLRVSYTRSGSATSGSDYAPLPGYVDIPAGAGFAEITITPLDDALIEPTETVILTLTANSAYIVGTPSSAAVTITSDDPKVTIAAIDATATEGLPPLNTGKFRVTRTGPTTAALTVTFTRSGTATAALDYSAFPLSVIIPVGSSWADIPVNPINDTLIETTETVILTLAANPAYTVGSPNTATVFIYSDEKPVVTITAPDPTAGESPGNPGTFRVSRTGPTSTPLTVLYTRSGTATAGSDYLDNFSPASVTIPTGADSVVIAVTPLDDALIEAPETVVLTLTANLAYTVGTPSNATVTITSDDPKVTITAVDPTATEKPVTTGTFRVTRTGPTTTALTVTLTRSGTATAGSDYENFALSLIIPIGETFADITVTPKTDAVTEPPETVIVTVAANPAYAVGSPSSATVGITETKPTVSIRAHIPTAAEKPLGTGAFVITQIGATATPLTVCYSRTGTATAGLDYNNFPTCVQIPAGLATAQFLIWVTPVNDALVEGPETVILTLTPHEDYAIGAPSSAQVTITSEDTASGVGTYVGPGSVLKYACTLPGDNGTSPMTATVVIATRVGTSISGSASFRVGDSIYRSMTLSGTVAATGQVEGTFTFIPPPHIGGSASFTGTLSNNTLDLSFRGETSQDTNTCKIIGSLTAKK